MKTFTLPASLFGLLYLCFLTSVILSSGHLPERVATHFGAGGVPDGWMNRSAHVRFTVLLGSIAPIFVVASIFACRFLPNGAINLPNRDRWLAPERRAQTFRYLLRHSLWMACLILLFIMGNHYLLVQANTQTSVQLAAPRVLALAAGFLAGVTVWILVLVQHFRRAVN